MPSALEQSASSSFELRTGGRKLLERVTQRPPVTAMAIGGLMAVALLGFTIFGPATAQEGADLNSAPACVGPDYQAKSTDELVQLAPVVLRGTVSMVGQVRTTSQCGSGVYSSIDDTVRQA